MYGNFWDEHWHNICRILIFSRRKLSLPKTLYRSDTKLREKEREREGILIFAHMTAAAALLFFREGLLLVPPSLSAAALSDSASDDGGAASDASSACVAKSARMTTTTSGLGWDG